MIGRLYYTNKKYPKKSCQLPFKQTCQLSRIMRESHAFRVFLTLTRLEEVFSRILPFSVIIMFITSNHTHLIDATPIKLINFNEY